MPQTYPTNINSVILSVILQNGVEEVEVTLRLTVSQSVCLGIEHPCGTCDRILRYFLPKCCCLKFAVLYLWGVLSSLLYPRALG
jgi:hypothetical protein